MLVLRCVVLAQGVLRAAEQGPSEFDDARSTLVGMEGPVARAQEPSAGSVLRALLRPRGDALQVGPGRGLAQSSSRRKFLAGAGALLAPAVARADLYSDLGVSRKDLGLPEPPPPPQLDPKAAAKQAQDQQRAAAKREAEEKRAAADAIKREKQAEVEQAKAAKAAAAAAEKEEKAKKDARRKELQDLGLTPEQLGLDGKPPKSSKPLTDKQKREQKKKDAEKKKKRSAKKEAAKKEREAAAKEAEKAKKALDEAKKSLSEREAEAAKTAAALEKALKKEKGI